MAGLSARAALVGLASGALAIAIAFGATTARSADHQDSPSELKDPAADIADLYTWTTGGRVAVAMTVYPDAPKSATFDPHVAYVVHTASAKSFTAGALPKSGVDIVVTFDDSSPQVLSLWVVGGAGGGEYVTGIANLTSGLASADGKVVVFAGLRADPFFFNRAGFDRAAALVAGLDGGLTRSDAGCALFSSGERQLLIHALGSGADGGAPANAYAGANVLAIVVSLDPSLLTAGGPLVSAWGGTYAIGQGDAGGP